MPETMPAQQSKRKGTGLIIGGVILLAFIAFVLFWSQRMKSGPTDEEIRKALSSFPSATLSGTIQSLSGDTFVLDVPSLGGVVFSSHSSLRTREVGIAPDAQVSEKHYKSNEEIRAERSATGIPPLPIALVPLTKGDLKVGDMVEVSEKGYPDLRTKLKIFADKIVREVRPQ